MTTEGVTYYVAMPLEIYASISLEGHCFQYFVICFVNLIMFISPTKILMNH